jgi:O-antigen/teichoic acid export membrane protein
MRVEERELKLFRNSLLNLMPTVVGIATSILTVPIYISLIGADRYGALLLGFVLLGYFGHVDFGLGRAITQRISSNATASPAERAGIVWSAFVGGTAIAAMGAALVLVAAIIFFGSFFEAEAGLKAEALEASWLFALCVPVIIFTGVSSGALAGLERFGTVSLATMAGNFLSQVLPLVVAAVHSVEISWLLGASIFGRVVALTLIVAGTWRAFLRGQPLVASLAQMRGLFTYGSWIMASALVGPLMVMSDRLVIGAAIGAAAVVAYSVPFQIASRTAMLPSSVAQALFPRLASQGRGQSLALGKTSVVLVGQIYALIVVGLICLAAPLLALWLGDDLDPRSILIGQIIMIGFWTNALAYVPYTLIQASGNSRFTGIMHMAELPIYLVLLFGLGSVFGLYGIALAFTLRTTLDCVILFLKARFVDRTLIVQLVGPAAIILLALALSPWANGWLPGIGIASALCGMLCVVAWLGMEPEVKQTLLSRMGIRAAG